MCFVTMCGDQLLLFTLRFISGGVNLGVMKAVGQAVLEGQSMQWGGLSSHRRIRCIGIATWGYVERNEHLISPSEGKVSRSHFKSQCYPVMKFIMIILPVKKVYVQTQLNARKSKTTIYLKALNTQMYRLHAQMYVSR